MPSPFAQYKGEQVPQINILPYTAGIANSIQQGMSDLGKGLGTAIEAYGQNKQEREFLKAQVQSIAGKYITQDPTEDAPKNVVTADAPDHIKQIATKAINSEDGWDGLSTSDMRGFMANHQRVQADARIAFDEDYKRKTLEFEGKRVALAEDANKLAKDRAFWENKKAADEAAIQEAKVEVLNQNIDPVVRHTFIKKEDVKTGTYINEATGARYEGPLSEAATALGVKPEDLISEQQRDALIEGLKAKPEQVVGRAYTRDANFDATQPLEKQSGQRSKDEDGVERTDPQRFIEGMYKASLRAGVDPDAAKRLFFSNKETGGFNTSINVNEETWAAAQKLATKPSIQRVLKNEGVNLTPVTPNVNKFVLASSTVGSYTNEKKVTTEINLNERELWDAKYEAMAEKWRAAGKMVPFSRNQLDTLIGDKSVPSMTLPNGQRVYVFGNKPYTEAQLNALSQGVDVDGSIPADETMAHAKLVMFDNWLRGYNKPTDIGAGVKIQFKGGYRQFRGDMEKDKELISQAMIDIPKITRVADGMLKLTADSFAKKLLSPQWNAEYENLRLTAETMRTYFIAKGQETDKDNARLAAIVADQGLWLKANPELAKKIIENFKSIVIEGSARRLADAGFSVSAPKSDIDRTALRKLLDEAESKFAPKK